MAKKAPVEELAEVIILLIRKFINWIYRQITGKDEELIKPPRIFKHGFSKKKILTNREFSFYKMLVSIVEPMGLRVFPKVRMIDIIETTNNAEKNNRFWQNKQIIQMHVDFLLVDDLKYLGKKPFRTYLGMKYTGGFSDHLPVYIDFWY